MPITEMIVGVSAGLLLLVALQLAASGVIAHQTARRVIDRDPSSAGPLLERIPAWHHGQRSDDRLAVILVALGTAMVAATLIAGDTAMDALRDCRRAVPADRRCGAVAALPPSSVPAWRSIMGRTSRYRDGPLRATAPPSRSGREI